MNSDCNCKKCRKGRCCQSDGDSDGCNNRRRKKYRPKPCPPQYPPQVIKNTKDIERLYADNAKLEEEVKKNKEVNSAQDIAIFLLQLEIEKLKKASS